MCFVRKLNVVNTFFISWSLWAVLKGTKIWQHKRLEHKSHSLYFREEPLIHSVTIFIEFQSYFCISMKLKVSKILCKIIITIKVTIMITNNNKKTSSELKRTKWITEKEKTKEYILFPQMSKGRHLSETISITNNFLPFIHFNISQERF